MVDPITLPVVRVERYDDAASESRKLKSANAYLLGALRTVAAMAKERGQSDIYGIAQGGIDLAELGEAKCAEMRGDEIPH